MRGEAKDATLHLADVDAEKRAGKDNVVQSRRFKLRLDALPDTFRERDGLDGRGQRLLLRAAWHRGGLNYGAQQDETIAQRHVCVPKTRSGRTDDEVRRE